MTSKVVFMLLSQLVGILGSTEDEWLPMPNGMLYHHSCIHQNVDSAVIEALGPCPYEPRPAYAVYGDSNTTVSTPKVGYYSDWSVYLQVSNQEGYGYMSNDWVVPKKPTSQGPAPPLIASSVYLFNGLEDGNGIKGESTLILQPVLQYGKSGCLLDPLRFFDWWLTSYIVANGRAHCGKNIKVKEGETVRGTMTLTKPDTQTWQVDSIRLATGETSTVTQSLDVMIDAAYITMEGMVIYHCDAYPASNECKFVNNSLQDRSFSEMKSEWIPQIRHNECQQNVSQSSNGDMTLLWNSTI